MFDDYEFIYGEGDSMVYNNIIDAREAAREFAKRIRPSHFSV